MSGVQGLRGAPPQPSAWQAADGAVAQPSAVKYVTATRTVRLCLGPEANAGKLEALAATVTAWDRAVAFYTQLFLDRPGVFEQRKIVTVTTADGTQVEQEVPWSEKDRLTWAESVTVKTPAHPDIGPQHDFEGTCPGAPRDLRRAAIHAGCGAVRGYLGNLHRWEGTVPKRRGRHVRGRKPKIPNPHPHLTAYAQMAAVQMANYRQRFVRLKVRRGRRWEWTNYPVQAPRYLDTMLQQSERERERIAGTRGQQRKAMAAEGRKKRTPVERQALRPAPGVWLAQSPTLIRKVDGWWLHLPFEKRVAIIGKAEVRRKAVAEGWGRGSRGPFTSAARPEGRHHRPQRGLGGGRGLGRATLPRCAHDLACTGERQAGRDTPQDQAAAAAERPPGQGGTQQSGAVGLYRRP